MFCFYKHHTRKRMRIVHLGYSHRNDDIRIFRKECCSLVQQGHEVYYITSDKNSNYINENMDAGVHIIILRRTAESNKIKRYYEYLKALTNRALELDADVYHIHETGLLPIWKSLKRNNKLVVYDSHEDTPRQMRPQLEKQRGKVVGVLFEKILELYEDHVVKKIDFVITATPYIKSRFSRIKREVVCINNYPIINDLEYHEEGKKTKKNSICFTGGISDVSGIRETVKALNGLLSIRLKLAGPLDDKLKTELEKYPGWKQTDYYGVVNHSEVSDICRESYAGIILYQPLPNHVNAQPNKMFEYMLMGLPIICSDFPIWKKMIEKKQCGLCVNPQSPKHIARAIEKLYQDSELAYRMGQNGRKAILEEYNWGKEEVKLFEVYKFLERKKNDKE